MKDADICQACFLELPHHVEACRCCGRGINLATENDQLCLSCQQGTPWFDSAMIPYRYIDPVPFLVSRLKYQHQLELARLIAELMLHSPEFQNATIPQALLPVPLHPKRYRERGFNQSLEIARHLANRLNIQLLHDCSFRIRDTPHQTGLSAGQRQLNLQGAFIISNFPSVSRIAIVDDVVTTGATTNALAQSLKRQGLEHLSLWAFAHA